MREGSGGKETAEHGWDMPDGVKEALEKMLKEEGSVSNGGGTRSEKEAAANGVETQGPFISKRLGISNSVSPIPLRFL